MLNLCVFVFIIYAVSYSARAILFGNRRKRRKVAYRNTASQKRKVAVRKKASPKNNIIIIKSGRSEKSGRPVNISDNNNHAIKVIYLRFLYI